MTLPDRWRRFAATALLVTILLATAACGVVAGGAHVQLTVYAAASLRDAVTAALSTYTAQHPGLEAVTSFDASSALAVQITQGAPADLFLSADTVNADRLVSAGLADGATVPFAGNRLVLVVPRSNPGHVARWQDLARPGVRVVAAEPAVPIQRYADELIATLASRSDAPSGFVAAVAANIASREDNVRAVLARIELGEGDAAVVYATDAATTDQVTILALPAGTSPVITYAGVVVAGGHTATAHGLLEWLRGPAGSAALSAYGFLAPPMSP